MTSTQSADEYGHGPGHEDHEHGPLVTITIGTATYTIHRGSHTVVEIKTLGGVPLADDLVHIVDGQLTPLADDGRVTIKGDERFVGHPKDSGAS